MESAVVTDEYEVENILDVTLERIGKVSVYLIFRCTSCVAKSNDTVSCGMPVNS